LPLSLQLCISLISQSADENTLKELKELSVTGRKKNHPLYKFRIPFLIIIFITGCILPCNAKTHTTDFPFSPGEKLTFKLKWYFIPAGEAVLEVLPIENIGGIKAYHFVLIVKTNQFFDTIYKIRDRIDSYTDIGMTRSILYKKRKAGGKHQRDILDPLSIFYYSRICDLRKKVILQRPVTDGKKCVIGSGKVIKRETIKLKNGKYDTYLLEPELKDLSGVVAELVSAEGVAE